MRRAAHRGRQAGVSLVELVSVTAIIIVLASITLPVANTMVKRQKELELRRALREIREAIDRFQATAEKNQQIQLELINTAVNEEFYPEDLKWLYEGVYIDAVTKIKFLRRLPRDPMTGTTEWGTRSSRDPPDALFTDGTNIFDVHTTSDKVALDGTKYRDW